MARNSATFTLANFASIGRIDFQTGSDASGVGFQVGDTITQSGNSAQALVLRSVLSNGSWAGGDAEGHIIIQREHTDNFSAAGADIENQDTATADPTVVVMDGNFDGRFDEARYYVLFEHTPDMLPTGIPARLTGYSLSMLVRNETTGPITVAGWILQPDDEMNFPIQCSPAGRRTEMREGAFAVFARWVDADQTLVIFVVFQGIEGDGSGESTTIREFVLSMLGGECGDWIDFDIADGVTFQLAYETNDEGTPSDPPPPPPPGSTDPSSPIWSGRVIPL